MTENDGFYLKLEAKPQEKKKTHVYLEMGCMSGNGIVSTSSVATYLPAHASPSTE